MIYNLGRKDFTRTQYWESNILCFANHQFISCCSNVESKHRKTNKLYNITR